MNDDDRSRRMPDQPAPRWRIRFRQWIRDPRPARPAFRVLAGILVAVYVAAAIFMGMQLGWDAALML
jgi:hypothetical protein